jgi:ribosomal protein L28
MSFSLKYPRVASIGHNVSHAKNKTRRAFKYNLHSVTVKVGDKTEKMRVPSKVLKMLKKSGLTTHYRKPAAE